MIAAATLVLVAPAVAQLGDGIPNLIYDPTTGNALIDPDGGRVGSFRILNDAAIAPDFDTTATNRPSDVFGQGLFTNDPDTIGWASSVFTATNLGGLVDPFDLGNVLPTGYDLAQLDGFLTLTEWDEDLDNVPARPFQLAVVPEPTSLALFGLSGLGLLRRRRQ
jgi:hypothetical protein